jgi:hypothetical protein
MVKDLPSPLKVQMRGSQIKFPSEDLSLNIIRCGTFSQGLLNRQIIILLYCLGVPETYFIDKQREALKDLNAKAFKDKIQNNVVKKNPKVLKDFEMKGMLRAGCLSGALKMLLAGGRDPLVEPLFS